ncbi:MAG: N-acetylneuraminate synthase family protein [Planctomycetota bacterium]|nr:N-acetylneuraminate synthase family protein [Planctomycetota bacterium]
MNPAPHTRPVHHGPASRGHTHDDVQASDGLPEKCPTIKIGDAVIGRGHPVYVIAEAGVNHNGEASMARELIDVAREAGADAIKFQLFSARRLVSASAPSCAYQHRENPGTQRDMLSRLELDAAAFADLKSYADRRGIHFLATPFGVPELKHLVRMDVPALKLASTDLINTPLLAAARNSRLPIILSTGASLVEEIDETAALLSEQARSSRLAMLHCVSAYPTPPTDARLRTIATLEKRYRIPVGFSDHTEDPAISGLAVAAGACLLEKHVTLRRSMDGPDHFFSLEPDDLVRYIQEARSASAILGDGRIGLSASEREVRQLGRGSIVTVGHIRRGTPIAEENLDIQRPGGGIDPRDWNDVIGRVAATDIPPDTRLCWSLLK